MNDIEASPLFKSMQALGLRPVMFPEPPVVSGQWQVCVGNRFIGIVESNLPFATRYWAMRSRLTGRKYVLKPVPAIH